MSATPTPVVYPTAAYDPYDLNIAGWTTLNVNEDPQFVGGMDAVDFDFHLKDPGSADSEGNPDIGWSDMGRHFPPNVPSVINLTSTGALNEIYLYHLTWSTPDQNSNGTLF